MTNKLQNLDLLRELALKQQLAGSWLLQDNDRLHCQQMFADFVAWLYCSARIADKACGACKHCLLLAEGVHPDYHLVKAELEELRALSDFLHIKPQLASYRIVFIENADILNNYAANALLKNLEEPGSCSLIFMQVSNAKLLLATIRSRCQVVKLSPVACEQQLTDLAPQLRSYLVDKTMSAAELRASCKNFEFPTLLYALEWGVAKLVRDGVNLTKLWNLLDAVWLARRRQSQKLNFNLDLWLETELIIED